MQAFTVQANKNNTNSYNFKKILNIISLHKNRKR